MYRIQLSQYRGASSWADWAREVRNSQPEYSSHPVPTHGKRLPAALTPGTRLGTLNLQDEPDQSGLPRLQGIWLDQITILIASGTQVL